MRQALLPILLALLAVAVLNAQQFTQPKLPPGVKGASETAEAEILKVFSMDDRGARFRAYVVKFKGNDVILSDELALTDKKVGDKVVSGHSKAATAGGMKCSQFEWSAVRRRFSATSHTLLETVDGECPQDGDCLVDTTASRGRMVPAANRQGTGDRPRDGGAALTTATTGPKCSHSARRLFASGRFKCSHFFAPPGSRAEHVGW